MIPKIEKILYTTDLSKNSVYALRYAIDIAEKYDAQIIILHVFDIPRLLDEMGPLNQNIFEEAPQALIEKIRRRVQTMVQKDLKDRPDIIKRITSIQVVEGDPVAEILRTADEINAHLLVMGTHGKGIIAYAFLGSVASKVLHRIRIPVFIVPIPARTDIEFND